MKSLSQEIQEFYNFIIDCLIEVKNFLLENKIILFIIIFSISWFFFTIYLF